MNIAQIYDDAAQRGIRLYLEEGRLLYKAESGALDPATRDLLKLHKTELIAYLGHLDQMRSKAGVSLPPLVRISRALPVRPSYGQEQLIFLDQFNGGKTNFNIPVVYRVHGELNVDALHAALRTIVERHEVLRSSMHEQAGEQVQVVAEQFEVPLIVVELADAPDREARIDRLIKEDAARLFDIGRDVLVRITVLKLGEAEHVLMFNTHHIVSDGWSIGIFMGELARLYNAFADAEPHGLPALEFQYRDYAAWQRQMLDSPALPQLLGYWRKQLDQLGPGLDLPFDQARERNTGFIPGATSRIVDAGLTGAINALCKRRNATMFMFMQTALSVLLSRYSGDTDIPIGTAIAGRAQRETEGLIGFFINTLVLRSDLSGNPVFADLLYANKQMILDGFAHQHVPFPMLVEELKPVRNSGSSPFFQVMLILQNNAGGGVGFKGIKLENMRHNGSVNKFDLELDVTEAGGKLFITWSYNAALFSAATVARMAANFEVLLQGIVDHPDAQISSLPLLAMPEREQLIQQWNDTAIPFPADACLHTLFEAQVAATPAASALVDGDCRLTYAELNEEANRLAHCLRTRGAGQGALLGLCMERSSSMVVAMLAILKAGGAYLPLDPAYPAARLAYLLADAKVDIVLTQRAHLDVLPAQGIATLCLDSIDLSTFASDNPVTASKGDSIACAIYTSGSTGEPKGVLMPHSSIVNRLAWMRRVFPLVDGEVFCQKTSLNFVDHVAEVFQPLTQGTPLVVIGAEAVRDIDLLVETLRRDSISRITLVPSLLNILADHAQVASLSALRYVISSGEPLTATLAARIKAALPQARLLNLYGSTEVGADVTCAEYLAGDGGEVSMGSPIDNSQAYILDEHGAVVPLGAKGELYIGGAGLAQAYLNQPALTAERFVSHPFSRNAGARLYRTGDLVRWRPDGQLSYLGRRDHQVKVRGMRIETGEVEAQLCRLPTVREAVVMPCALAEGESRLVAYLVASATDAADYRKALRLVLPDHMVPDAFVFLDALPLTRTGKIDRKALPQPGAAALQKAAYVAPRNETEAILCSLWESVLKLERVGIEDNFFESGGHSLLATRLMSMVRQRLGVEMPLRALFDHPTIAGLSETLGTHTSAVLAPIVPADRSQPLHISFAQQRLWFLDQLEQGSAEYNLPLQLELKGRMDVAALRMALQAIVDRHEVLRTSIVSEDGQARQLIREVAVVSLVEHDLQALDLDQQEQALLRLAAEDANRPFDLSRDVLLRGQLFLLSAERVIVQLNLHHIAADGWSMGILFRELNQFYNAFSQGQPSPLFPLRLQYADYAQWQRNWLQGEVLEGQLGYWREQLHALPSVHNLPLDKPRPAEQRFHGNTRGQRLDAALLAEVQAFCQREQVTLFMFLQTAFTVLLKRYSNEDDIVMGSPIAGRTHADVEPLIGLFVNSLVLRSDVSGNPGFRELLQRNKQMILSAYEHQFVPFEMLVEQLQPERSLSHSALFQIMLTLHNNEQHQMALNDLSLERKSGSHNTIKCDLELTASVAADHLYIDWTYNIDLFEAASIDRMGANFDVLLRAIVAQPAANIAALPLLTETEREQLLHGWNDTGAAFDNLDCLHIQFEAQVAARPNAAALREGELELTYAELNARANRFAHYLLAAGVKPGALVGLCMERSAAMVVAMLAILKAGGAYLPLDPGYPAARLAYLLGDAKVDVVVTQAAHHEMLPADGVTLLCLDQLQLDGMRAANPDLEADRDGIACAIYTSGSTGEPKGVLMRHSSIANRMQWMRTAFPLGESEVFCQKTSLNFVDHVAEIFQPLTQGTPLVVIGAEAVRDIDLLVTALAAHRISRITLVPSLLKILVEHERLDTLGQLRYVISSGEPLSAQLAARVAAGLPHARLLNLYGSTEVGADVTCAEYLGGEMCIGRPIANSQAYVLDETGALLPLGAKGELYIGGAGLARGYLNQPALTADRFVAHPYSPDPSAKLYRTGDMVRWLPDGQLNYLGRSDHQVKVRGMRIEIGEVEAQLSRLDSVREAVVMPCAVPGREDETRLVAYLVADAADSAAYRKALRLVLPDYMVPEVFMFLEALPLTRTGKIDRKALPQPAASDMQKAAYVAPRDATETTLCQLWETVLKLEKVGIEDNFFESGGDSIGSMLLVSRARQQGLQFSVRDLFANQTIAAMATELAARRLANNELAMSAAQHYLMAHAQDRPSLMQTMVMEPASPIDAAAIASLAAHLHRQHDALRAVVDTDAGSLRFVAPVEGLFLDCEGRDWDIEQVRQAHCASGAAFQISALGGTLVVSLHRAIADPRSWTVLHEHITLGLRQLAAGQAIDFGKAVDYAAWLRTNGDAKLEAVATGAPHSASTHTIDVRFDAPFANGAYRTSTVELLLASFYLAHQPGVATAILVSSDGRGDVADYAGTVGCFERLKALQLASPAGQRFEQTIGMIKAAYRDDATVESKPAIRFNFSEEPMRCEPAAMLGGEEIVIDHVVAADKVHITLRCGSAVDGARLLGAYAHHLAQTMTLCGEEIKDASAREQYADLISYNSAELELYGEEF